MKMKPTTAIFALSTIVAAVSAQNTTSTNYACLTSTQLNQQVPPCAGPCQLAALSTDGCPFEDLTCHCVQKTGVIQSLMATCLATQSTCGREEIATFISMIQPMCASLNATASGPKPVCPVYSPSPAPVPVVPEGLFAPGGDHPAAGGYSWAASGTGLVPYAPKPTGSWQGSNSTPPVTEFDGAGVKLGGKGVGNIVALAAAAVVGIFAF
ncbi:hypothetical protein K402DRAFT_391294 [Aulographum hederae CBS 113979]|uniref:CFEM domain-containing protein n=1 Tax=Aulographum hederae CBS 113979 TaxID=1176131 RepID=A0A6G1H848_9PEZI|nr:hypothetical protein K402DRAFT_391294 [Aulographum hederae CBS 113979]